MADQTMAAEREASVALVGPFTLRDVIVAVSVALLFLASVLPTAVVRGIGLNAWNSAGLFQLALSILLPAAVLVLFVIRRIAPKTKLRIGSLSVDQFASVAASFATAFYFLVMVNVFSLGAVVGFLGSLGLLTATVFAPWIPGFASDFAGRHEIPAHPVARDAVPARPKSAQPTGPAVRKETKETPVGSAAAAATGAGAAAAPAAGAGKATAAAGPATDVTGTGAAPAPAGAGPSGATSGATAGPAAVAAKEPRKMAGKVPVAPSAATGPAADAVAPGAADGEAMGLPDTEHAIADAARAAELKSGPAAAGSGPAAAGTGQVRQGAAAAAGTDRGAQQAAAQAGGAAKTGTAGGAAAATAGAVQAGQQKQQPEAATAGAVQAGQQKQQPEAATASAPPREVARDSGRGTPAGTEPAPAAASGTPAVRTTGTNQAATVAIDTVAAGPARDQPISATREAAAEPEEAVYEAFWFAVGRTRPVFDENTGAPVFTLEPGAWILALQDRGDEFLVQHTDGRVGVLRDLTNIERA
ncbi:hypothetical protein LVY72_16690 [Arthrobacter sp. I2-34]|uniref:Uncharacterized protein n=1 Tax=Arthrobacter hankyongi TaxID=2904801 RepID=A0ABS9LA31_9MICC|nr:hypothetical protein [Arthrobacter hankyongi]MCG2623537.1 hypothetical protein [Arthrobacter hankyongi]